MYSREEIKANPDIFEKSKSIDVANMLTLSPINPKVMSDPSIMDLEATIYMVNSSSPDLKEAIPGAYVQTIGEAKYKISEFINKMIFYDSILYCIRLKTNQIPIGYILLNSPLCQNNLPNWSIDFWLNPVYRGKKIMASSLREILGHMQDMEVSDVYAMTDSANLTTKRLLEKFGFQFVNERMNTTVNKLITLYILRLN
jgi:RimJ/RimL family protein N-acetyltransferase